MSSNSGQQASDKSASFCPTLPADEAKKSYTWVPHETEGFALGRIVGKSDDTIIVDLVESGVRMEVPSKDCQPVNPPKCDNVEDTTDLKCTPEASVNVHDSYSKCMNPDDDDNVSVTESEQEFQRDLAKLDEYGEMFDAHTENLKRINRMYEASLKKK
uniref:Myosin N-terminal SH3-like domain-containing protein n=1 Tax=Panagrellus redivivus TaxID=6233 RepID=A0A7E4ZZL4_PANRE